MIVSDSILFGLSIGIPVALLALAIAYRTLSDSRQASRAAAEAKAAAAQQAEAEGKVDELLNELQTAVEDMRAQLTSQRETLEALKSDAGQPAIEAIATPAIAADDLDAIASRIADTETPQTESATAEIEMASIEPAMSDDAVSAALEPVAITAEPTARAEVPPLTPAPPSPSAEPKDTRTQVLAMLAEGLTDRQVARRLRIGVEEVRLIAGLPTKATRKRAS